MSRTLLALLIALTAAWFIVWPTRSFATSSDTTPPTFVSFASSPKTATPGDTVTFTAHIVDAGSGVHDAAMCVIRPDGKVVGSCVGFSLVSGTPADGIWEGTYHVPAGAPNGLWKIFDLDATDAATNRVDLYDPSPPVPDGSFTVTGGINDTTPPTFLSFAASPKTVMPGDTVTFTAHLVDSGSGVHDAAMCVIRPDGTVVGSCISFAPVSGTLADGIWEGTYHVPAGAPNGLWKVFDLDATDVATNRVDLYDPTSPVPDGSFTVTGGTDDTTAPTFVSFASSPKTVMPGDTVTFTAHITDPGSGVHDAAMCVIRPDGTVVGSCVSFSLVSGTPADGIWEGTYHVPAGAPNGLWKVFDLDATDLATNRVDLYDPSPPVPDGFFTVAGGTNGVTPTATGTPTPTTTATPSLTATVTPTATLLAGTGVPATATPTATITAASAVGVRVMAAGADTLVVLVEARGQGGSLHSIRFGGASNALLDVPDGPSGSSGGFTQPIPPGSHQFVFVVRRVSSGQPSMVPFVVVDDQGEWPTFVGGGQKPFR